MSKKIISKTELSVVELYCLMDGENPINLMVKRKGTNQITDWYFYYGDVKYQVITNKDIKNLQKISPHLWELTLSKNTKKYNINELIEIPVTDLYYFKLTDNSQTGAIYQYPNTIIHGILSYNNDNYFNRCEDYCLESTGLFHIIQTITAKNILGWDSIEYKANLNSFTTYENDLQLIVPQNTLNEFDEHISKSHNSDLLILFDNIAFSFRDKVFKTCQK